VRLGRWVNRALRLPEQAGQEGQKRSQECQYREDGIRSVLGRRESSNDPEHPEQREEAPRQHEQVRCDACRGEEPVGYGDEDRSARCRKVATVKSASR
jgi:hypothetical protein